MSITSPALGESFHYMFNSGGMECTCDRAPLQPLLPLKWTALLRVSSIKQNVKVVAFSKFESTRTAPRYERHCTEGVPCSVVSHNVLHVQVALVAAAAAAAAAAPADASPACAVDEEKRKLAFVSFSSRSLVIAAPAHRSAQYGVNVTGQRKRNHHTSQLRTTPFSPMRGCPCSPLFWLTPRSNQKRCTHSVDDPKEFRSWTTGQRSLATRRCQSLMA